MCVSHRDTDRGLPAAVFHEPREDTNYSSSVLSSDTPRGATTLSVSSAVLYGCETWSLIVQAQHR
jgi:hypothetical protein